MKNSIKKPARGHSIIALCLLLIVILVGCKKESIPNYQETEALVRKSWLISTYSVDGQNKLGMIDSLLVDSASYNDRPILNFNHRVTNSGHKIYVSYNSGKRIGTWNVTESLAHIWLHQTYSIIPDRKWELLEISPMNFNIAKTADDGRYHMIKMTAVQ